jgi:hypothetical protein
MFFNYSLYFICVDDNLSLSFFNLKIKKFELNSIQLLLCVEELCFKFRKN